jgi:hypothetical protein
MSKTCSACKQVKPTTDYYKRAASSDGLQRHCKVCSNTRVAKKRANNREYMRSYMRSPAGKTAARKHLLKKKYKLSLEEFDNLLAAQDFVCACCKRSEPGGASNQWNVDHCHESGKVRGLLCNACNIGIGCLGDDLQGARNALQYLERHYNDNS